MLRLAVTLQLVLTLALGPAFCCCTATRLAHGATAKPVGSNGPRKSCCAPQGQASEGVPSLPAESTPAGPTPCPCKGGSAHDAPAPEVAAGSSAIDSLLDATSSITGVLPPLTHAPDARRVTGVIAARSLSMPSSDPLDAHHNLRC